MKNQDFRRRFPACSFYNAYTPAGPADVIELFGGDWEERCAEWEPLVIRWIGDGPDGPESAVYLLLKNAAGELAEVHGSSSSMWAFEGSWTPEKVSRDEMLFALWRGWLRDEESNPLRGARAAVAQALGVDLDDSANKSPKDRWEAARAKKAAAAEAKAQGAPAPKAGKKAKVR